MNMLEAVERAIRAVMLEGNGAKRYIPSSGGQYLRVSYLWGKLGLVFVDEDGKIVEPARRVGGRAIAVTPETSVGEGAATQRPPVQLALPHVYLQVGEDAHVDPD